MLKKNDFFYDVKIPAGQHAMKGKDIMNNDVVHLVWRKNNPERVYLYVNIDNNEVNMEMDSPTAHFVEDSVIDYIEENGAVEHGNMKHLHSIVFSLISYLHEKMGDRGVDNFLSGLSIILYKVDDMSQRNIVCDKEYTYSCLDSGRVNIIHA